jgi:TM2 domain-containing membrane protein YozV
MNDGEVEQYQLRWRGRTSGPYPLAEINRMLDEHDIGMGHEILHQGKWMVLEEFFAAAIPQPLPAPEPAKVDTFKRQPVTLAPREKKRALSFKVSVASNTEVETEAGQMVAQLARPRNRMVFAFLAICLGFLGVHNFYARQWLTGLLQVLLSIATSLMGFGIIAPWLWAMIEALVVRKDGDGIEMT